MNKPLLVACVVFSLTAVAAWPTDPTQNVAVSNLHRSFFPTLANDSNGGIYVIWEGLNDTNGKSLRGEHFNAQGERLWSSQVGGSFVGRDLLNLSLGAEYGGKAQAIGTSNGDVIIVYTAGPSSGPTTLHVQRFDDQGSAQWTPTGSFGGVQLLANPNASSTFMAVSDQLGGVLITYPGSSGNMYGQRVNSAGQLMLGTGGVSFGSGQMPYPPYGSEYLNGDGMGGMYYIWAPTGAASQSPALQHLSADGGVALNVGSVAPSLATFGEWSLAGGTGTVNSAWVTWNGSTNLYLQRFLSDGGIAFTGGAAQGLLAATLAAGVPPTPTIINDGQGGAINAWFDQISGVNVLQLQRYAPDGSALWGAQPVLVSNASTAPRLASEITPSFRLIQRPDGDVEVFWAGLGNPGIIYGERIALNGGARLWGSHSGGVPISPQIAARWLDVSLDKNSDAYVAFEDQDGVNHVYLTHVLSDGTVGTSIMPLDAGVDAGFSQSDAGQDAGLTSGSSNKKGCGCTSTGASIPLIGLGTWIVVLMWKRRRPDYC